MKRYERSTSSVIHVRQTCALRRNHFRTQSSQCSYHVTGVVAREDQLPDRRMQVLDRL